MRNDVILFDMETQRDLLSPGGSLYSPAAREPARNIRRLIKWARREQLPILSTVLRIRRDETGPLAQAPHCVEGTPGETKISGTLLPGRINLGLRSITDLPEDLFEHHQQVIVEKRHPDIFVHARLERLITELAPRQVILFGGGLAAGLFQAAVGLRSREFDVWMPEDAVVRLGGDDEDRALARIAAKGTEITNTQTVISDFSADAETRSRRSAFSVPRQVLRRETA